MKTKKLLSRLTEFFNSDRRAQLSKLDTIKEVLKNLKKKEHKLKEELENETDPVVREKLETKLNVCHTQRKKGLAILKELNGSSSTSIS
jgi:hypothetical protein